MNREIKFRAWDKYNKRMINRIEEDGEYAICFNGEIRCIKHGETPFNITLPQGLELQQFTGLLDKNGKEIWEGDVVKYEVGCSDGSVYKKIASVKYGEFNCSCCDGVYGWYFDDGDIRECDRYEVIGNVMENPDLLNK